MPDGDQGPRITGADQQQIVWLLALHADESWFNLAGDEGDQQ